MKKIAIVTATRAEYGLLTPLIRRVAEAEEFALDLIATGAHFSEKQGYTIKEIFEDGFPVSHEIPILETDNSPYGVSATMANALKGFAQCFKDDRPDLVVILGDRTEMLGVASAAMNERIPIAHIHGGEVTEGAVDDCVRHAITKMSYLHFTAADIYRRRVIQLGEAPERVFNVGSLGTENILNTPLIEEKGLRGQVGLSEAPDALVTFHPVTLEEKTAERQAKELCFAMDQMKGFQFLITKANADAGGDKVNQIMEEYAEKHKNVKLTDSLGMQRYLSALKYAAFVLGNSSSGILEAPVMGTPTVNIGDRQKGRLFAGTVVCCEPDREAVLEAMRKAIAMPHVAAQCFGDGRTSYKILNIIRKTLEEDSINLKKGFWDLSFNI